MTGISAWEAHKRAQEQRIIDREAGHKQRRQANKEHEAELRRRCAVERYRSPFSALTLAVRAALNR